MGGGHIHNSTARKEVVHIPNIMFIISSIIGILIGIIIGIRTCVTTWFI